MNRFESCRRLSIGAALTAILAATPAGAQESPRAITLDQAIAIALEQNPTVQQAENAARLTTLALRQEQRALLPELRITSASSTPYASGIDQANSLNAGVSASVQISNLYSTMASIDQAKLNEEGGEYTLDRSRQTVVFQVISDFLAVVEAQEQLAVQEQNLVSAELQEAQIQAYVDAGERSIADLYQQQATTAGASLALVQAERGLVVSRMNLVRTLQLDPFDEYAFVAPSIDEPLTRFESLDLATLSGRALGNRPDLAAAELQLSSAQQEVRIADAARWPTLSLGLGYGASATSTTDIGFVDQLNQARGGTLQLGVSIPILDATSGIVRERARIQVENARIGLANTLQAVATEVRTAYLDLGLAEQQLQVAELQLRAAELALETAQQRYDVGAATLVELTQARSTQVRAASDLVNARYGLLLQNRLMEYYLGDLGGGGPAQG